MNQRLALLLISFLIFSTGCSFLGSTRRAVDWHKLEGLTVIGDGERRVFQYPNEVGGVNLATFDLNQLSPSGVDSCRSLKNKAGTDFFCFNSCNSLAREYSWNYKKCFEGVARFHKEEEDKTLRAYINAKEVAQAKRHKKNAIAFMETYAKANNLEISNLTYYYEPLSIEYVMARIKKGEFKVPTFFNVKCCGGYEVSQPLDDGYMLITENYGGLPIILKTNTTLFEGNKAGASLGWLKYEGVTKYKTVIGTDRQAILMTEIQ